MQGNDELLVPSNKDMADQMWNIQYRTLEVSL